MNNSPGKFPGNNYPRNSFQEINGRDRMAGLSATPLTATLPNRVTNPNTFLTENYQNQNQALASADFALNRGIINNNNIKYPKNPREYGLYLDRKEFKLDETLWPNISENVAAENVNEYVIVIDSSDRNVQFYPSPFYMKAFFSETDDATRLNVPKAFENVKFMRIENVVLPRNYYLTKYTVIDNTNITNDATILAQLGAVGVGETTAVQALYDAAFTWVTPGNPIPSPIPSPGPGYQSQPETVLVTNLTLYTYSVVINYTDSKNNTHTSTYQVVYPNNPTYNSQYYSQTVTSGSLINNSELNLYLQNAQYNLVQTVGGTKQVVLFNGTYTLTFTLSSTQLIQYIVEFMMTGSSNAGFRCSYEFIISPGATAGPTSGQVNFYYFSSKSLDGDRYLILNIEEITDNNINSTNDTLRKAFCLLYPDSYGELHYYAATNYQDKIYKMSSLGNINRLTFTLMDSFGRKLVMPNLDYHITTSKACNCDDDNYGCPCTYIRHPYYKWLQVQYMIKLGVVETEIDKKIFY